MQTGAIPIGANNSTVINKMDCFQCDLCQRTYTRKYNLQVHIQNFHIDSSGCYCDVCKQTFSTPSALLMHLQRGHNRNNQSFPECDLCGKIFMRKQNIIAHMISVHFQYSDIKCHVCEKNFPARGSLKRHIQQMHEPGTNIFICDYCKKEFKEKDVLQMHIVRYHCSPEKYGSQCKTCGKAYSNTRNLRRHIDVVHGKRMRYYKCCYCSKVYFSNDSLQRHVRTRHLSHPLDTASILQCEKCNSFFNEMASLRLHIKNNHSFEDFYEFCKMSLLTADGYISPKENKSSIFKCEILKQDKVYQTKCNVCYKTFYTKESLLDHKKFCTPPPGVHHCDLCSKLFTDISSLDFHKRIFHPQVQVADSNITSTNDIPLREAMAVYKCMYCSRMYYSDRSLKHHMKMKHTTEESVTCNHCGKTCSNKYYLASHIKLVHNASTWSKCDYCDKTFKSRRNIRRHMEYTHMETKRFKCLECDTLFKEKRSLRKHVRTKHPDSPCFPQCHICGKRFESAKSCKIHLKIIHSFNMNTHPCHLCSESFDSYDALQLHLQEMHTDEDVFFKCGVCNLVFKGEDSFEKHRYTHHMNAAAHSSTNGSPECVLCSKFFSSRKTLKRHLRKFHVEFDSDELANFGIQKRNFNVDCDECLNRFNDEEMASAISRMPSDNIAFECDLCDTSYSVLEFSIQRHKIRNVSGCKSQLVLSELCTAEMSDYDSTNDFDQVSTTAGIVKQEPIEEYDQSIVVKSEVMSD